MPQAETTSESGSDPIRVTLVQPALPAYRVPVFRELSARDGIDLTLRYATQPDLANAAPVGFRAEPIRQTTLRIAGQSIIVVPELLSLADPRRCDVLLAPWNTRSLLLRPTLARARKRGVGTVVWGHGYSKQESPKRLAMRDAIACKADAVVFYNHGGADAFRARQPASLDEGGGVFVAINSLDQTEIQRARDDWLGRPDDLAAFRAEQGLAADRPVAVFVSRLLAQNRAELLIEATAKLNERGVPLTTVIIGKGPHAESLERTVRQLDMSERVRMVGAIYGEPAIAPWFLCADVFAYPVNMGLSAIHALGYGLPIVTSADPTAHGPEFEALAHGENAMLLEELTADALADAIAAVVGDPDRQSAMSAAARATVLERFNVPVMVDGLEAAIRHAWGRVTGHQ